MQNPAHAGLDLALLAAQLHGPHHVELVLLDRGVGSLQLDLVHVRLALAELDQRLHVVEVRVGEDHLRGVRLDVALAQRAGHRGALHHHAGVDDVVLAGPDQAAVRDRDHARDATLLLELLVG